MSKAQVRSIKFVRPTDECDVCEGDGVDFGLARYAPVRLAVRENVLWSIVIRCSHGTQVLGLLRKPQRRRYRCIEQERNQRMSAIFAIVRICRILHFIG